MATNSIFGVQPFEELAQEEPPASPTSLEDFYREQERKDLERRISRIRRRRRGSSRGGEPETQAVDQPPAQLPPVYQGQPLQQQLQQLQQQQQWQDQLPPQQQQRQEQPSPPQLAWQQNQQSGHWWTHESTFKTRYEIHNPTPNPYPWVNHHLLPPGTTFPPTIKQPRKSPPNSYNFTPSLLDSLPRPKEALGATSTSSSSTSTFPRSRSVTNLGTTSALHHDNVDFLDASDPWGLRWHHDGRYDVGDLVGSSRAPPLPGTTSLPSDPNRFKNRQGVRRSGPLPSPLSQSTSATQLPLPLEHSKDGPPLTRKLSKRHSANAVATIPPSLTPTSERHLFSGTVPGPSAFKLKTKRGSVLRFFGINSNNGHSQESTTKNAFLSAPESSDRRWLERRRSQTLPSSSHPAAHQQSEKGFQVLRRPTADANIRHITQRPNIPPSASEPHIPGVGGNGGNDGTSPSNKDNYLNPSPSNGSNNNNGMLSVPQAANPKEKRGSVLGRLVKKLSLVKKDNSNEWERQGGLALGVNETAKRSSANVQTQASESGGKGSRAVTPNDYSAGEDSTSQQHHAQDQPVLSKTGPFGSGSEFEYGQSGHAGTGEGLVPSYPHQLVEHLSNPDQQQHQPSPTRPIPDSPKQQQQQTSKPDIQLSLLLPQDEGHNTPPRMPFRGQELERERGRRDSSDGHSSPELQYTGQLGGLMITNPDLTSDTGSMLGYSPRPESQQRQNGQLFVPRAPFAFKPGMLSSAESSPHTPFVPLRQVTNPDPETETEGGTLKRPNTAISTSGSMTEVVVPPLPEVKRESAVRTPTQDVERRSEERERPFKRVNRDPRLLALAEVLNPSARKPIPELSVSPAMDEELMPVFTSSPLAENDDANAYIKSPKSSATIDEIMDLSLEPPQPTFSPSGMTTVLEGLQSPKGHLQQPNKLEPFVDPLDDKPLPTVLLSRNSSIMSRATTVPPTPPPKSFAQLARLAAPRLTPTERVPWGTEEVSPLPSPGLPSPPARPTRNSSRVASAASTPVATPGRLPFTPVVRSPSPRMPSSPSIATIPSPSSLGSPSTLPDPAGSESTLTTPALSAIPTIPSPAVYIPTLPPPIPTKPVPRPAPTSRPTNDREGSMRPKINHANSYHASSSFATPATTPTVKRPSSLEAQLPPYSIAQALEKTPSTVSSYTTAPDAPGKARIQSTSVFAPLDAPVSRSKSKKENIPALGTDWEVIEAIMMQSPDSPTPNAPISPTSPIAKRGSSSHAQQAPTSGSGSGSQWRREERERLSINGTSDARQDGYPPRLDSYSAPWLDDYSPVQGGYGSNKSPSHSRTGSGDVREARERERAKESNKVLYRSPTAPAAPVKSSSPTFQEKARGSERLVKSKSRRDRERELEREREKEKELSRRTSQPAPSGTIKLRSKTGDTRVEQDPSKSALNSNLSTRRARPTSEVAVEPTQQLRAQEAWDHARMIGTRGQSVVMPDRFSVAPPPPQTIPSYAQGQYQPPAGAPPPQYSQSQQHQNDYLPRGAAGSSHTQFVVEPPFQQHAQGQQQQQQPRAWPAYQYRQYAYYPVQRQTQPVEPNPLPPPPAQINYPPQRVNR